VWVTQKGQKAEKIRDFPCRRLKIRASRIALFFDILIDFSTSLDIFGRILGAAF
jgi:hypothetical protein